MAKSIILVAGAPGAGKTTILKEAMLSSKSKMVNMGTMMLQAAQKLGYASDRDKLRFMDVKKTEEVRNKALADLEKMEGNIVIDIHASIEEHGRYLPGLPAQLLDGLGNVKGLIYVDATTEEITARRNKDKTRTREREDDSTIDTQRLVNISMLSFAASHLNVPLYIIMNKEGAQKTSVEEIKRRIREATGD